MNNEVCLQRVFLLCYHSYFPFGVHSSDNPVGFHKTESKAERRAKERQMQSEKQWADGRRRADLWPVFVSS